MGDGSGSRHAELIIEQMNVGGGKGVSTPGCYATDREAEGGKEGDELRGGEATKYRAVAARCNYLALDRPDIQYAVKEACRDMSKPNDGSWQKLIRIARYLRERPRLLWKLRKQEEERKKK